MTEHGGRDQQAPAGASAMPLLVARAQLGDRGALDRLLATIQEPLYRHIAFVLGDDDTAEDVLQDTLLAISRKLGTLRDPRWFRAWAFRIATRLAIRHARRDRQQLVAMDPADLPDVAADIPESPFDAEVVVALESALADAPPASQLVLRMHYFDGLTLVEIAEALEISVGTVKSRLSYGLAWLRRVVAREPA